jgi:hypothetical protein
MTGLGKWQDQSAEAHNVFEDYGIKSTMKTHANLHEVQNRGFHISTQ